MTEQTKEFPSLYSITGDIKDINIALVPRHISAPIVSHQQSAQPVCYVNGNELDNMLDDRTATIQPAPCGYRKTPLYRAIMQPVYLDGVNTERLSQALTWMGVAGPVSKESYVSDMALYVNALTSAVMTHKGDTETSSIVQPVQLEVRKEIEAAVLAERKACAEILDRLYEWSAFSSNYESGFNWGMQVAADLIRARSQTESIVHKEAI